MNDSESPLVSIERRDDGVAVVRLQNPKVNAISSEVLRQIRAAADALNDNLPGAVVFTGGDRLFAAGADITEFKGPDGCELALACDFRIASTKAKLGQPEILLGIIPGGGGTQRLPRLVGPAVAKDLIFTGRQVSADEALHLGLVDRVTEPEDLEAASLAWATELAAGPSAAIALAKAAIDRGLEGTLAAGLDLEQDLFVEVFGTADAEIGVASFLEHGPGKATFTGA